jgi:nitrogen regulatory protein P-II 1
MHLLVCVIDHEDHLDAILSGFVELGVTGATLIKSEGMGRALEDLPVFAGLQSLLAQSRPQNTTVLSVIKDPELLGAAVAHVKAVADDLAAPGTGIMFTIALDQVVGLARGLGRDGRSASVEPGTD